MKFNSKIFGEIEIDEKEVFEFPNGIIGFPEHKRFFFLKVMNHKFPFPIEIMHSFDSDNLAFFVVDPFHIAPNYSMMASMEELKEIDIQDITDVTMRIILRIEKGKVYANLLAPIVLNIKNKRGKQFVLEGPDELLDAEVDISEKKSDLERKVEGEAKDEVIGSGGKTTGKITDVKGTAGAKESQSGAGKTLKGSERNEGDEKKLENQSVVRF